MPGTRERADDREIVRRIIAEAVAIHAAELPPTAQPDVRFARIVDDLRRTHAAVRSAQPDAVADLEARWETILTSAFPEAARFAELRPLLDEHLEPAFQAVGLLDLFDKPRRETLHTAALGALMSPARAGAHGTDLLAAFLDLVCNTAGAESVPREHVALATVAIEHEYERPARGARGVRVDLVIRIEPPSASPMTVVVENKIDDRDREGQLAAYSDHARQAHAAGDILFVYLTPEGSVPSQVEAPEEWIPLGYEALAVAWRGVLQRWDAERQDAWSHALRAYLHTLVTYVAPLRFSGALGAAQKARAVRYMLAATGRTDAET